MLKETLITILLIVSVKSLCQDNQVIIVEPEYDRLSEILTEKYQAKREFLNVGKKWVEPDIAYMVNGPWSRTSIPVEYINKKLNRLDLNVIWVDFDESRNYQQQLMIKIDREINIVGNGGLESYWTLDIYDQTGELIAAGNLGSSLKQLRKKHNKR